jgi:regulator of protease activity HflC (stomatin/prohibitin superfamily)
MKTRTRTVSQVAVVIAIAMSLTGCAGCTRVSPGYVGIKSTVVGTGRGLEDAAVGPAWVFYNMFTESVFEYPTFAKTAVWTQNTAEGKPRNEEITFTNKDRMQISADISLAYQLLPDKAAAFYIKFRSDDMDTFTDGLMRNWAREKFDNVAGRYTIDQIMGDNAQFLAEVRKDLQDELTPIGIQLIQFGFIGAPRPPASVTASINMNVQATQIAQQKQNEVMQATADAKKEVAKAEGDATALLTRAESQAKANKMLADSLSPTLVQYRMIDKWNGVMPTVQGSGQGLIMQLPGAK